MDFQAQRKAVMRAHKLSEVMVEALLYKRINDPKSSYHGVIQCSRSTEGALVNRGLIHKTRSTLTDLGREVVEALTLPQDKADRMVCEEPPLTGDSPTPGMIALQAEAGFDAAVDAQCGRLSSGTDPKAFLDCVVSLWPRGTRVTGRGSAGTGRTGTVNGADVGYVINPQHPNHGRAYVGVDWDRHPATGWHALRGRAFIDGLTLS